MRVRFACARACALCVFVRVQVVDVLAWCLVMGGAVALEHELSDYGLVAVRPNTPAKELCNLIYIYGDKSNIFQTQSSNGDAKKNEPRARTSAPGAAAAARR